MSELQLSLKGFRGYSYEFVFGVYQIDDRNISIRTMCDYAAMARQSIKKNVLESIAFYNKGMQKAIKERKFVESHMQKHSKTANLSFIFSLSSVYQAVKLSAMKRL